MVSRSFARVAGVGGVVAGVAALAYSVTFAVVVQDGARWASWTSTVVLGVGALAALPVLVALFQRVRATDESFALLAFVVGVLGAAGTLLHAAYDLANLANPPATASGAASALADLPSATDPRGFATFLLAGLTLGGFSLLLGLDGSRRLAWLGGAAAPMLVVVWIGRLTVLDPKSAWLAPFVVGSGFVAVPLWYVLVGWSLLRPTAAAAGTRMGLAARPVVRTA
jgi:hypothetical protein